MSQEKDLRKQKKVIADVSADTNGLATEVTLNAIKTQTDKLTFTGSDLNINKGGLSTLAEQQTQSVLIGSTTETAPATDTALSGLNGRLQRIAQRITSLIALLPISLGQKTMAQSFAVTLASDQTAITSAPPVSSSATITRVSVTTASIQLTASVPTMKKRIFFNEGAQDVYVKYGATASVTSYSFVMQKGTTFEEFNYNGIVTAITNSSTSNLMVTEI
jgi:hypothetical protein